MKRKRQKWSRGLVQWGSIFERSSKEIRPTKGSVAANTHAIVTATWGERPSPVDTGWAGTLVTPSASATLKEPMRL
jgi:hypothetical protein